MTLRGVEGVAIQYAKCCRPIPGDKVIGQFRKGHGLLVHTRECVTLKKQRPDPDQLVDVEWAHDVQGVFDAGIRLLIEDRRGLLAELALAIADAEANIDNVSLERPDGGEVSAIFFSVQVQGSQPPRARDAVAEACRSGATGAAGTDVATRLRTGAGTARLRPIAAGSAHLSRADLPILPRSRFSSRTSSSGSATAACAALSRARLLPSTVAPTAPQFLSVVV